MELSEDIRRLPKAELHVHIEGTITPEMARRKAAEHGLTLPDDIFNEDGTAFAWKDFPDLVTRVYDAVAANLTTKQDFADVTYDYLKRCAEENVIYVELIASPDHARRVGLTCREMIDGMAEGIERARRETGIEARINTTLVRHLPHDDLQRAAEDIVNYRHKLVTGLDLAGVERPGDLEKFRRYFDFIKTYTNGELGMRLHAGEYAGPENVADALRYDVTRIGHGVRVTEDPALMDEVRARGIVLEVCPTSNVLAGIYPDYAYHPLRLLYEAGIRVTLNSDDPGLFGNSVGSEYQVAHDHFGFSTEELVGITRTAIEAAYVDEPTRRRLLQKIDDFTAGKHNGRHLPPGAPPPPPG